MAAHPGHVPVDLPINFTESSGAFYSLFFSAGRTTVDFQMRGRGRQIRFGRSEEKGPERRALTSVMRGLEHLTFLLDQSSQGWAEGELQCGRSVHLASPLHQPHSNLGSAFRQSPQLSRWAAHL